MTNDGGQTMSAETWDHIEDTEEGGVIWRGAAGKYTVTSWHTGDGSQVGCYEYRGLFAGATSYGVDYVSRHRFATLDDARRHISYGGEVCRQCHRPLPDSRCPYCQERVHAACLTRWVSGTACRKCIGEIKKAQADIDALDREASRQMRGYRVGGWRS